MLRPLNNKVVIKKIELEDKTASGIILQSNTPKPEIFAEVLAIGPDVIDLTIGDKVVIREFAGMPVEVQGQKLIIISQVDILAKLN